MKPLLVVFMTLTAGYVSAGKLFHHVLDGLSITENECAALTDTLAKRFAEQTGLAVYTANCTSDGEKHRKIQITYLADSAVTPVDSMPDKKPGNFGTYETLKECVSDLEHQKEIFCKATGVSNVFTAYCRKDRTFDWLGYGARVQAFAKPTVKPQFFFAYFGDPMLDASEKLEKFYQAQVLERLEKMGETISNVVFTNMSIQHEVFIRYYKENLIPFRIRKNLAFQDENLCKRQVSEVTKFISMGPEALLAAWCYGDKYFLRSSAIVEFVIDGKSSVLTETTPDKFSSFDQCQNNRERVVTFYREKLNRNVFGAICFGGRDGLFMVRVMEVSCAPGKTCETVY